MIGAIAGDMIGSTRELGQLKTKDFPLFETRSQYTDDTVMTIAIAHALAHNKPFAETLQRFGRKYHNAGYGKEFKIWINNDNPKPYGSWGNGAAMRVTAIGLFCIGDKKCIFPLHRCKLSVYCNQVRQRLTRREAGRKGGS